MSYMSTVDIAIAGIGNCASALIQGLHSYDSDDEQGLAHPELGGIKPTDVRVVAAFDVDERKVGYDLSEAIFATPNCTREFVDNIPFSGVKVRRGPLKDELPPQLTDEEDGQAIQLSDESVVDVAGVLKESRAEVLVNLLPVGSKRSTAAYAHGAIEAGCAFVNCIPVPIASSDEWERQFENAGLPVVGDDVKSQIGGTSTHCALLELFHRRGASVDQTYQLNVGGNTDFLTMLNPDRAQTKKATKTGALSEAVGEAEDSSKVHSGPSDYVPWLDDEKVCFLRIEGEIFGGVPVEIDLRLQVTDSPNCAGSLVDAVRAAALALRDGRSGPLEATSAFLMKNPPNDIPDHEAAELMRTETAR